MNTTKLTRDGFKKAFHAAWRLYWEARATLNLDRTRGAAESACRLAALGNGACMLTEAQETQLGLLVADVEGWNHRLSTGRTTVGI